MAHKDRQFTSLEAWQTFAEKQGLKAKKVSVSKAHGEYWQAISPTHGIVGYFLTGESNGHIHLKGDINA